MVDEDEIILTHSQNTKARNSKVSGFFITLFSVPNILRLF